jgi:hypothetical protein
LQRWLERHADDLTAHAECPSRVCRL